MKSYPASEVRGGDERSYHESEVRAVAGRSYSMPGVVARRSNPTPEARGGSQEDQPHVQGAVAVWA